MDGYDVQAATARIAKALRRAGAREPEEELRVWIDHAIDADMAYMKSAGVLGAQGERLSGEAYDEDDACEAVLAAMEEDGMDEAAMQALLMKLDAFMEAEIAYLEEIGLMEM